MNKEEMLNDLKKEGFEIFTIEQEREIEADDELVEDMERQRCTILLSLPSRARCWYFTDTDAMLNFFNKGLQLDLNRAYEKIR